MHNQQQPRGHVSLYRPVALFLDGMSRAALFPFGPSLVARLVYGNVGGKLDLERCSLVAFPLVAVVVTYMLGRSFGSRIVATKCKSLQLSKYVPRIAGVVIALHVFTLGAGLSSVWWLALIRFLSAMMVGVLCSITKDPSEVNATVATSTNNNDYANDDWLETGGASKSKYDHLINIDGDEEEQFKQRDAYVDITPGTAKLYLTALAVSILSGGLLYRHATKDETFQDLTGQQFTLSPLFLIAVSVFSECMLRLFFWSCHKHHSSGDIETTTRSSKFASMHDQVSNQSTMFAAAKTAANDGIIMPPTFANLPVDCENDVASLSGLARQPRSRLDSMASFKSATPLMRERSATVESEFFDCNSVLSDMDNFFDGDESDIGDNHIDQKAGYTNKSCVYSNGSPAFVQAGDCVGTIPPNYLAFCNGKVDKAKKMWTASQKWRHEQNVWRIHRMPNTWFSEIKKAYPHYVHGFSKAGYPIIYEQPGRMNLKQLFRNGCKINDMVRHLIFFMEFIGNHIAIGDEIQASRGPEAGPHNSSSWGTMVVMDIKGAGISHLSGDVLRYLKEAGDANANYYPMTMKRAFLVNSPFWLAGTWSSIKGILPESVQVDILSSGKYLDALREYIDDDQIPPEYGGSSPYRLGEHPFELSLQQLVDEASDFPTDPEPVPGPSETVVSFDHNRNSWRKEVDGVIVDDDDRAISQVAQVSGTWSSKISLQKTMAKPPPPTPLRRRTGSASAEQMMNPLLVQDHFEEDSYDGNKAYVRGGEDDIFAIVSIMFTLFSMSQGVMETAIPLWILTPTELGGLGYAPSRSGVSMFCSAMVLLWVMRTKWARVVPQMPTKAPMRSFRIGAGSQSVLLMLIALVPKTVVSEKRSNSILVMAFTIIMISCMILSSIFGRSSSTILHRIAASSYANESAKTKPTFSQYCQSGDLTHALNLTGEILGALLVGIVCSWALTQGRPAPFDGTSCLYLASLLTFVLYVGSFSLHLNVVGQFSPHPRERDGCSDAGARRCGSFLYEVATVSLGDMASLFEETNWAYSPLLSHQKYHDPSIVEKPQGQGKKI